MLSLIRYLLFPVSLLYGIFIHIRNLLYNKGFLLVFHPKVKSIVVGNLSTGGTGKTPHIEYLIKLLSEHYQVATISRGYGRKSKGFRLATSADNAISIGDEPSQYFQKFNNILVAVDANRKRGIKNITAEFPSLQVVLLDDAFQHRSVEAGLKILLTDYAHMYYDDVMLPTGNLREFKSGIKRADIIVVSKTPAIFSPIESRHILARMNAEPHQHVFFSFIKYNAITHFFTKKVFAEAEFTSVIGKDTEVLLFAGIANPSPLEDFVRSISKSCRIISFNDHHWFTQEDLKKIEQCFYEIKHTNKIILTTEKDAMRLLHLNLSAEWVHLPLFFISIAVQMHSQDEKKFNQLILNYVGSN